MEALTSRSNWNLDVRIFVEVGKLKNPEKSPWGKGRTNNQAENKKGSHFCSVSPTDWHCAVFVWPCVQAGRQVILFRNCASFTFESLRALTIIWNLKKCIFLLILHFISFTLIYTFLWF